MTIRRSEFHLGLIVLGLSGAAALGHQVLWTRRLMDLIGSGITSSTLVLECFFLGMAIGSAFAGRGWLGRRRPWLAVGYTELGIAVLCLPILFLPVWTSSIWPALGPEKLQGWQGLVIQWGVGFFVVVPPAFLMGMTLPLVMQAVGQSSLPPANPVAWLYAAYTLGGALGLTMVVGFALHLVGVSGSMLYMVSINLLLTIVCLLWELHLGRHQAQIVPIFVISQPIEAWSLGLKPLLLAFCSGLGIMTLEVLGLDLINLKLPLAFYTPAAVLTCVVLLLGCSAAGVPYVVRWFGGPVRVLIFALATAGITIASTPLMFLSFTSGQSGIIVHGGGVTQSLLWLAGVTCISLGPAVALAGIVFPALILEGKSVESSPTSKRLGQLLAINGLGGIIGAEVALRFLLPKAGVHVAFGILGGFYSILSVAVWLAQRKKRIPELVFSLLLALVTVWLLGVKLKQLPIYFRNTLCQVLEVHSGGEGSLAVVERVDLGRAMFLDNLYLLGCSKAVPDLERQAHLPLLLHPAPSKVGFIGLGTGITSGGALRHVAVESITSVELSPLVAAAAQKHFNTFNQGICNHPKAAVLVLDGGPFLAATKARFDVIIGDLFTPWRPGEARLCSLEQFAAAKQALLPGGVFCQWLPMSQLTDEGFQSIVATFLQVFDQVHLFRNHFKTGSTPLALVGFKSTTLDWDVIARRCQTERQGGRLRDPLCRHVEGVALLYLGTYEPDRHRNIRLNTLENLQVELSAGRHMLAGNPSDYFYGDSDRWLMFLERQVARIEGSAEMLDRVRKYPRVGLLVTQWEIAVQQEGPLASSYRRRFLSDMPDTILKDSDADWSYWPGPTAEP